MELSRRTLMTALGASAAMAGCSRPEPAHGGRDVLAAGQPASVLVWCLAPERLLGWPRRPGPEALALLPPAASTLPQIGALTSGGAPANLEATAALRPSLVLDYGDVDPDYVALGERLKQRLGADWRLIDGALAKSPQALREAGGLLEVGERAGVLADRAEAVLARWRGAPSGPSFYYARAADGLETGFRGALATEVLEGAGWLNVAEGERDIGRVTREQIVAWDPEAVVTLSARFAAGVAEDPLWRRRRDGSRRRLLVLPETPFGWIDRPPSINRLLGCAWLGGEPFATDAAANGREAVELMRQLYGPAARPEAIAPPRWIA